MPQTVVMAHCEWTCTLINPPGGLAAVIYTDTLQTFIMIIGAVILTITGTDAALFSPHLYAALTCNCEWVSCSSTAFNKIGGYENLERVYSMAVPKKIIPNSSCHLPRQDAMHLFRDAVTGDLPWPGMTLGLTILATWYWCSDQVTVQSVSSTFTVLNVSTFWHLDLWEWRRPESERTCQHQWTPPSLHSRNSNRLFVWLFGIEFPRPGTVS